VVGLPPAIESQKSLVEGVVGDHTQMIVFRSKVSVCCGQQGGHSGGAAAGESSVIVHLGIIDDTIISLL